MATGSAVDTHVTLEGAGAPYKLDAFSGRITPIADYTRSGDTVTVRVSLGRDASTVIALSDDPQSLGLDRPSAHVTSTTADGAAQVGHSIVVRAANAGTYATTLDTGQTVSTTLPAAPAAIDLTGAAWHLDAEDWQPQNPYGTLGSDGTLTKKVPVSLDLAGLKAWPDIPQLANASGIGTYSTTVDLPAGWDSSYGATLGLGRVTDTFTLTVDGQAVGVDAIDPTVDVGPYLHAGANTIVVRVATTFNNRLVRARPGGPEPRADPELRPRRAGRPDALPAGRRVQLEQHDRHRRRHRPRDAGADARRSGELRDVHAGRGWHV